MIAGGLELKFISLFSEPNKLISSSLTILTTICAGETLLTTSWPRAFSRIFSIKSLATDIETSDSNKCYSNFP